LATRDLKGRRFDRRGRPVGKPFVIASSREADEISPAIVGVPGGGIVALWEERSDRVALRARIFNAVGRGVAGPLTLAEIARTPVGDLDLQVHGTADRKLWVSWSVEGKAWFGVWEYRR